MPPVLFLIDGHALAYRTYFALNSAGGARWQTRSGEPTAGVYGFISVILRILENEKPEYLAVAFDTGKTFRDVIYPEYKATRAKMPDDLRVQIDRIREVVDAFNFPRLEVEGFEADDVLGTIAKQAVEKGFGVKIITGDKDLLQLVNDRISVNLAGSKLADAKDYNPQGVKNFLGVRPDQVVDYKALIGDKSDNIPGVPGIGEKTALTLFEQYETLDDIYTHIDALPHKIKSRLEAGRDKAYMSQNLATIRTDVKVVLSLESARTNRINFSALEKIFQQLEFRSLIGKIKILADPALAPETGQQLSLFGKVIEQIGESPAYTPQTRIVNSQESLDFLVEQLSLARQIGLDTETTGTNPLQAELVGISLAVKEGEGYYIPIGHKTGEAQLPFDLVRETLQPYLRDKGKEIIGHNLKFDSLVLDMHGITVSPLSFDTMIAEWLVEPESRHLGLKDMAEHYLNIGMTHIEELIGKGKNQITMAYVPVEKAAPYAAADAEVALRLKPILEEKIKIVNAEKLLYEIEMPLIPILASMEKVGISLDIPFFHEMAHVLDIQLKAIQIKVTESVGHSFNLNSTQQLSDALFKTLMLQPPDPRKKTASGHYSTSADILEQLRGRHPVVDLMLEYREYSKLKSTYVDSLPGQINPHTGRVHTSFNQVGSVTGRLASSDPNLQNIPIRSELGRRVREGFIASPGNTLLAVDYSQIELRIVAHMSGDEAMLDAFRQGRDIHIATAAAVYGIPLENVTKDQRRNAKGINFGLIYGMSAFGLSNNTGITLGEAEDFVKTYFQQFPGVKKYLDGIRQIATKQGWVETMLGRRRNFPNLINPMNQNLRNREEREAINAPIQGTAADIIKIAMIQLAPALSAAGLNGRILLQVHDELILEIPQNEINESIKLVQNIMENAYPLSIPLLTEARWGNNWGSLETVP